jgi:Fe-S-cluster containining protein
VTDVQGVRAVYEDFDVDVRRIVLRARTEEFVNVPCTSGCDHCCYDIALSTSFEADVVVEHVRRLPQAEQVAIRRAAKDWLAAIRAADIDIFEVSPDVAKYARAHLACPLLDTEKHECRVYDSRPIACRGHFLADGDPKKICANRAEHPVMPAIYVNPEVQRAIIDIVSLHAKTTGTHTVALALLPTLLAERLRLL